MSLKSGESRYSAFTYYCLHFAEISGGVGIGVGEELADDELLVDWELLELDDCDDAVVLGGGLTVSVQETVVIAVDVEDELVEVELVFCWAVEGGRDELRFCDDDSDGPAVPVIEGPITVTVPDLVVVTNVEEFVLKNQEVVILGPKVERVTVGSVPLSLGV